MIFVFTSIVINVFKDDESLGLKYVVAYMQTHYTFLCARKRLDLKLCAKSVLYAENADVWTINAFNCDEKHYRNVFVLTQKRTNTYSLRLSLS